ncbi:hypothetical protein KIL84_008452 [Mauremys mutica]|uniref:Uncharacterized protein n=1 Tax=Mauremys mutica TaxID=74926 RepID=A0A9D4AXC2_9SAUR|nr:hypothetical protein KIL84_008452 [Mauremys mutica]
MAGAGSAARRLLQPGSPRGSAVGRGHAWGGHAPAGRDRARLPGSPPARGGPRAPRGRGGRCDGAWELREGLGAQPGSGSEGMGAAEWGVSEEPPRECLAPLGKEREAAKAEEQQQSEELLKQTEAERQKIVWEWQELRGFLEEQEQRLLSRLEELERAIVQRRDEAVCSLSWQISLLSERGEEKGQQLLSEPLQGAGSTGGREDGRFWKPEPGYVELEKRLHHFSLKSSHLQEVLLGFKETLRQELGSDTGTSLSLTGHGDISDQ